MRILTVKSVKYNCDTAAPAVALDGASLRRAVSKGPDVTPAEAIQSSSLLKRLGSSSSAALGGPRKWMEGSAAGIKQKHRGSTPALPVVESPVRAAPLSAL